MDECITNRHSPSIECILVEPLPDMLKMPHITEYDRGGPISDLDKYMLWMELQGANNAIMYRAFFLTLGNKA